MIGFWVKQTHQRYIVFDDCTLGSYNNGWSLYFILFRSVPVFVPFHFVWILLIVMTFDIVEMFETTTTATVTVTKPHIYPYPSSYIQMTNNIKQTDAHHPNRCFNIKVNFLLTLAQAEIIIIKRLQRTHSKRVSVWASKRSLAGKQSSASSILSARTIFVRLGQKYKCSTLCVCVVVIFHFDSQTFSFICSEFTVKCGVCVCVIVWGTDSIKKEQTHGFPFLLPISGFNRWL